MIIFQTPPNQPPFLFVISILTLDVFRSVRFAHSHVVYRLPIALLNTFYHALKTEAAYDHSAWNGITASKTARAAFQPLASQPFFLSIDGTMVEKSSKHFELCFKLYNHAAFCSMGNTGFTAKRD